MAGRQNANGRSQKMAGKWEYIQWVFGGRFKRKNTFDFVFYDAKTVSFSDINECNDPAIAARCVENAECCNLPAHFLCKCLPGFVGDGEVQCLGKQRSNNSFSCSNFKPYLIFSDIDECTKPNACGTNALCQNTPGNYTCVCPEGFVGNPYDGVRILCF